MSDKKQKPQVRWALKCDDHVFVDRLFPTIQFLISCESDFLTAKFEQFSTETGIPVSFLQRAWWENQKKKHEWKAVRVEVKEL